MVDTSSDIAYIEAKLRALDADSQECTKQIEYWTARQNDIGYEIWEAEQSLTFLKEF